MGVSLIAAMANNRVIGLDNKMPWRLPADLAHFKQITLGKPIIMGRKTFDSIGRPLPGRDNIVLTRNDSWSASGVVVKSSLEDALNHCDGSAEVMIIGGAKVYEQALPIANAMYLTFIELDTPGDAFFPRWSNECWVEERSQRYVSCEQNPYDYRFTQWRREKIKR